jgi:diguanylate cyclase
MLGDDQGRGGEDLTAYDDAGHAYPDPRLAPWPGFALAAAAAVEQLDELVDLDLWLVTAVQEDSQSVIASAGTWAGVAVPGTTFRWQDSFCIRMVERKGPTVAPDVQAVAAYAQAAVGPYAAVRAYVGVPLEGDDGTVFGTLCGFAGTPQTEQLGGCLGQVQLVARLLSTILAREQFAQARSSEAAAVYALVERDALTGLRNRRGWESALQQEDIRRSRYGGTSSVLALDLDQLAASDAPPGPAAVDDLLVRCAEVLTRSCRPGDVLARIGTYQFAVLALECDPVAARALLARLRVQLRTAGVAASTGAATRRAGERLAQVWQRADAEAGKDRRRRRGPRGQAPSAPTDPRA